MENAIEFIKAHPVPIGIGVVILILLMSRGSSQPSSGSVSNAAAYQAEAQITGINSATSIALGAQSVDRAKVAADAANSRMGIASNFFAAIAGLSATTVNNNANNTNKVVLQSFASADNRAALADQLKLGEDTINANVRMNVDNINGQLVRYENDNNFKLSAIGAQTQGNIALINAGADAQMKVAGQQNAFIAGNLPTLLQHEENVARITGTNAYNLADITGRNQIAIADSNNKAQQTAAQAGKNKSDWGIVSDIGKIVASFFGG